MREKKKSTTLAFNESLTDVGSCTASIISFCWCVFMFKQNRLKVTLRQGKQEGIPNTEKR